MRTIFLLTVTLFFFSCGKPNPVEYNDNLVKYYNEADKHVGNFYNEANRLLNDSDMSALPSLADIAVEDLRKCIEKVNKLDRPDDAEELNNSVIIYMEALVTYVNTMNEQYNKVTSATSETEYDQIESVIEGTLTDRIQKNKDIIEAQKAFAKAHNFQIKQ